MTIQKAASVTFIHHADGTSTSFSVDLTKDVYIVPNYKNWFTDSKRFSDPVDAVAFSPGEGGSCSASLSGTVVTVTYDSPPAAGFYGIGVALIFA